VLYPKDTSREGKMLRLKQQYFFVACSIADLVRRYLRTHTTFDAFADKVAIQLNDTHPAIAIAELMRVLVDEHRLGWDEAWSIVCKSCAYTNHTLLPEALEIWPVEMFSHILPRHLDIIREIDRRFQRTVHVLSRGDAARCQRMAIVDEASGTLRMAHLAVVGSHKVNGVAALHGQLLREYVLKDFAELWPERFTHVTNGVTPRRWLLQCNPGLCEVLRRRVGKGFETDMDKLRTLLDHQDDPALHLELAKVKHANKQRLALAMTQWARVQIEPTALFDVQVKRIHEYKRQLMCALHVAWLYWRIRFRGELPVPRVVMIGGKAAPGYVMAKQHIKLVSDIQSTLATDPVVQSRLQLVFVPNYGVSRAERIVPAADLSEQISLAGKEASGTGNMKFMMNGALTIGTLDGANVEILEEVGEEAFFRFGLDAASAQQRQVSGYDPEKAIAGSERLQAVLGLLEDGYFATDARQVHTEIAQYLRKHDPFLVCADFDAYCEAQERVEAAWADPSRWGRMVVRNIACSGRFSSDRTVLSYAQEIWGLKPTSVDLVELTQV
jgi:starch phosphorylase